MSITGVPLERNQLAQEPVSNWQEQGFERFVGVQQPGLYSTQLVSEINHGTDHDQSPKREIDKTVRAIRTLIRWCKGFDVPMLLH